MTNLDIMQPSAIIALAEQKGNDYSSIKTNQIRNFFSGVLEIKNKLNILKEFDYKEIETLLFLLKPKIAYAAGRQRTNSSFRDFKKLIDDAIEAITNSTDKEKATKNFIVLMESIVAYHKFNGGE